MSNYTPGPWGTDDGAEVWPMEGKTSFVTLCRVVGPWSDSQWYGSVEEGRANGRLIAAAPELLERLKAMVSGMECECDTADPEHPLCEVCWSRQVIAKAEGTVRS
jgi:hypothetical protein